MSRRHRRRLGGIAAGLAAANVARSALVPSAAHLPFNVGLGVLAGGAGWAAGLDRHDVGLEPGWVRRGLRWGLPVSAAVVAVLAAGAAIPATAGAFDDARADIDGAELLVRAVLVIPIGTVLVEELAFRGVLLGLAHRVTDAGRAAVLVAGLFGLWHVFPAWRDAGPGSQLGGAAGTFLATTVAGIGFGWLRVRSRSLLAPVLAHTATNSGALAVAWVVAR